MEAAGSWSFCRIAPSPSRSQTGRWKPPGRPLALAPPERRGPFPETLQKRAPTADGVFVDYGPIDKTGPMAAHLRKSGVRTPTAAQTARRNRYEQIWIVLGVLWAVGRVVIAKATVEQYGVNITVFAIIEILVAWPHALGAARVVTKLIDRDPHGAMGWGALLAVTHIAPELYIAVVGNHMPVGIYISLVLIVVGLGALAIVGIIQKVRVGRAERGIDRLP